MKRLSNLSHLQKYSLIPYFSLGSLLDPSRADLVHGLGDVTASTFSPSFISKLHQEFQGNVYGKLLLHEKPIITTDILKDLNVSSYPVNSLGYAYYHFMKEHDFSSNDRSPVRFIPNTDEAYVMLRYRQIHDFWHVLCDLPPTVFGELALKWFEWKLTGLPVCLISGVFGPMKLTLIEKVALMNIYIPWAMNSASHSRNVMTYYYEKNLWKPLDQVRQELNIIPAPSWKY